MELDGSKLSQEQISVIKEHLNLVFTKATSIRQQSRGQSLVDQAEWCQKMKFGQLSAHYGQQILC